MRSAKRLVLASLALIGSSQSAWSLNDDRLNSQLLKLDPATRLEQTCDAEVMFKINKENKELSVDKVIAYTFGNPTVGTNSLTAPGAALRSRGSWYHLSFYCETGPQHLDAHKLSYQVGAEIPQDLWTKYFLYD